MNFEAYPFNDWRLDVGRIGDVWLVCEWVSTQKYRTNTYN